MGLTSSTPTPTEAENSASASSTVKPTADSSSTAAGAPEKHIAEDSKLGKFIGGERRSKVQTADSSSKQ